MVLRAMLTFWVLPRELTQENSRELTKRAHERPYKRRGQPGFAQRIKLDGSARELN
jgi:hypothetical protein